MKRSTPLSLLLAFAACSTHAPSPEAEPETEPECQQASERLGELACLHRTGDATAWKRVAAPLEAVDQLRGTKYMLPSRDDARLPPVLLPAARFGLHYDFLVEAFSDLFAGLTPKLYLSLLFDPDAREFYVGSLTEYRAPSGASRLVMTVTGDPQNPDAISCREVKKAFKQLRPRVWDASLAVAASDTSQLAWLDDCDVPSFDPQTNVEYESYHRGVGFGTVRLHTVSSLAVAVDRGQVGFQDLVIVDSAPPDLDTVVSGAVTGSRQAPLSHLAVRSASRGTPNCFVKDAHALLARWEDQLVRMECGVRGLNVRAASAGDAEMFWETLRPTPVTIRTPDADFAELPVLAEVPTNTPEARGLAVARFGAKGANLAWLDQDSAAGYTPRGLLLPVSSYLQHLDNTHWQVDLGEGNARHTLAETVKHWAADSEFQNNAAIRRERLAALQEAFKAGSCDPALLSTLASRIEEVFGSTTEVVRFRSSSNAEDGAFFNGAGLYDSYSGCAADDFDDDEAGPSRCEPDEPKERGACRALKKVWASLFNPRAVDERAWYGIDPSRVAMGVLVSERSQDERANMVAFSGNPVARSDRRYLVNAQVKEIPVVSAEPGTWPEQVLLTIDDGGQVDAIERVLSSSELGAGEAVLDDPTLRTIGKLLSGVAARYPFDDAPPAGKTFLLDTEWKVEHDGLPAKTRFAGPGVVGQWYVNGNTVVGYPEVSANNWGGRIDGRRQALPRRAVGRASEALPSRGPERERLSP